MSSDTPKERAPMKSFLVVRSQSHTSTDSRRSLSVGFSLLYNTEMVHMFVSGLVSIELQTCHMFAIHCTLFLYVIIRIYCHSFMETLKLNIYFSSNNTDTGGNTRHFKLYTLQQGSLTFFSPRTPSTRDKQNRDPHM